MVGSLLGAILHPKGWGRGIAIDDRRKNYVPADELDILSVGAVVATVSVSNQGSLKVEKVDVVFEQGYALINPEIVDRQMRGQVAWAMSAGIDQEITIDRGRVVQGNFDDYGVTRMADFPKEITISYMPSKQWTSGVGEEIIPSIAPAITNAIFAATGKRHRSLPLKNQDLSWT